MKKKGSDNGLQILYDRYVKGDPNRLESIKREILNCEIAQKVYEIRTNAGLTQTELAKLVGTTKSAISRLENTEYTGHSISMLQKIAYVVGMQLEINFVKIPKGKIVNQVNQKFQATTPKKSSRKNGKDSRVNS